MSEIETHLSHYHVGKEINERHTRVALLKATLKTAVKTSAEALDSRNRTINGNNSNTTSNVQLSRKKTKHKYVLYTIF